MLGLVFILSVYVMEISRQPVSSVPPVPLVPIPENVVEISMQPVFPAQPFSPFSTVRVSSRSIDACDRPRTRIDISPRLEAIR
jgi:hypothetical protein